jgi:hypothetical protein
MPACWNGKDLDSPNHMDHASIFVFLYLLLFTEYYIQVAYLSDIENGKCPTGYVPMMKVIILFCIVVSGTD